MKLRITTRRNRETQCFPGRHVQDPEFARRDSERRPDHCRRREIPGAGAYGGVFTKDQLNFTHPILLSAGAAPKVDEGFEQKMSAYSCATMLLYDPESSAMYTTFFGGISRWRWNDKGRQFTEAPLRAIKPCRLAIWMGCPGSTRSARLF